MNLEIEYPKELEFSEEMKKEAIEIAAFGIIKDLHLNGYITDKEIMYIKRKHNILID